MRFVGAKSVEQKSRAAVFRARERFVHQRIGAVNGLRALLYEHGYVFPVGLRHLSRMAAIAEDMSSGLPVLVHEES